MKGIEKGIESWAKIMMPVLYAFGIILCIRSLTLGAPVNPDWSSLKGLNFIWNPDFSTIVLGISNSSVWSNILYIVFR